MALTINGELVPRDRIEYEANCMRGQYYQAMQTQDHGLSDEQLEAQLQEWAKDNVIEEVLLRQEAVRRIAEVPAERLQAALEQVQGQFGGPERFEEFKTAHPEEFAAMMAELSARVKVELLREKLTERAAAPKKSEIAEFYVKHKDQFSTPEMIHARHVVKHTGPHAGPLVTEGQAYAAICEVKKDIDAGRTFEEVADEHSDCSGGGGDLGWFPRGEMVESFEEVLFAMQTGQVSAIFKTEFGYHIAKMVERRPASVRPLDEVQEEISTRLLNEKKTRIVENFLDQQRAKAVIEEVPDPEPAEEPQPAGQ